jgi:hypothetical protein
MCDDAHISALAAYATHPGQFGSKLYPGTAEECAVMLRRANEKSLWARYPRDADELFEATFAFDREAARRALRASSVEIIKSAHCFAYQACETNDWEGSEAHRVITRIIDRAVHDVPGYDDANWGEPRTEQRRSIGR